MNRVSRTARWVVVAVALASAGCGSGNPLSPSDLALLTQTETYSGTLVIGGQATHAFVGRAAGAITLTLTALAPDATVPIGLGLGNWDGTSCAVQISTTEARVGTAYQATVSSSGNYCVAIVDVGTLTGDMTYTVQVVHP